jgi:hypothetical protein
MEKTIEVSFPGGKKVDGKIENMIIKTDQPIKDGGEGTAPEPFHLFWHRLPLARVSMH